jgi:hypothetical protein
MRPAGPPVNPDSRRRPRARSRRSPRAAALRRHRPVSDDDAPQPSPRPRARLHPEDHALGQRMAGPDRASAAHPRVTTWLACGASLVLERVAARITARCPYALPQHPSMRGSASRSIHQGFKRFHPSDLPLACGPRMERAPLGLSPELRTRPLRATQVGVGTGHRARTCTTLYVISTQPPILRVDSMRATSRRTRRTRRGAACTAVTQPVPALRGASILR